MINKYMLFFFLAVPVSSMAMPVSYTIPVQNPELEKFSKIVLEVNCSSVGKTKKIDYFLPAELTGISVAISMKNSENEPNEFHGENAKMHCGPKTCEVKYRDLSIDKLQVEEMIFYASSSAAEFKGKLAVAESFAKDPGGIILGVPSMYCFD